MNEQMLEPVLETKFLDSCGTTGGDIVLLDLVCLMSLISQHPGRRHPYPCPCC